MAPFSLPADTAFPSDKAAVLPAPLPTPSHGPGGSFTIASSTRINAPPSKCLDIVRNAADYPSWNPFCRLVKIDSQPSPPPPSTTTTTTTTTLPPDHLHLGTVFTFDVHFNPSPDSKPSTRSQERVSVLEDITDPSSKKVIGHRIGWVQIGPQPDWMLRCERIQEFVQVEAPDGKEGVTTTEYRNWETFYGAVAVVVRLAAGEGVRRGFEGWMGGLKKKAEEGGGN
ncbi:hypothetical protein QBC41DRAFT_349269 [Cercophora samala]|uniref:Coenzyme Q-binding protein COQ10 START domain-containing protein n=1 Tax=Cercophora samala TaxID=330535 RepID=A0AA39Z7W1_9PEZI|nr:hypothetical protein QBC41DRAFT_349269 [Cercophora samala]